MKVRIAASLLGLVLCSPTSAQVTQRVSVAPGGGSPVRTLEESSLRVRKGIVGGIVGPVVEREMRIGYDRNRRTFCAVLQDGAGLDASGRGDLATYQIADLTRAEFIALMDGVLARNLGALPTEIPIEVEDIYRLNTGLEMHYGNLDWENRAPGGCLHSRSRVQPSAADREQFEILIAWITDSVGRLGLRHTSEAWAYSAAPGTKLESLPVMRAALKRAGEEDFAANLDLNRAFTSGPLEGSIATVRIPWRTNQPIICWPPPGKILKACSVRVDTRTNSIAGVEVNRPDSWDVDEQRRRTFLDSHPRLEFPTSELIRAGWIRPGMSRELVLAAWGEPKEEDERGWRYERDGRGVYINFKDGVLWSLDVAPTR